MREYTVYMEHIMSSVQTVVANNEDEAKAKALKQSFEEEHSGDWEEQDTRYIRVEAGSEAESDEDKDE